MTAVTVRRVVMTVMTWVAGVALAAALLDLFRIPGGIVGLVIGYALGSYVYVVARRVWRWSDLSTTRDDFEL